MIGVRKNSGVIRLLMAAALVLFVAACSSSSNNSGIERERDQALETVEELEGTVVDLTGSVEELMGQLAALQESGTDAAQEKIEMLEARIAELEKVTDVVDEAARKAAEAGAKALFKGLGIQLDGDADTADFVGVPTVTAKYGSTSKVVPVSTDDLTGNAENANIGKGTAAMLPAVGPWSGTMVSAQDKDVDGDPVDTVVAYTDIMDNLMKPFATVFGLEDADAELPILATHDKYIVSDMFSTDAGITTHGDPDKDDEEIVIAGTFAGAMGHYRCDETDTPCTSQGSSTGVRLGAGWTFDPDAGEMASTPDAEYARFGWWWRVNTDGTYQVDVFHGSSYATAVVQETYETLTGSADYEGPAVGKFAINSQFPGPGTIGAGHFSATATLSADFEKDTVRGSIQDFILADVHEVDWEIALNVSTAEDAEGTAIRADASDFTGPAVWTVDGVKSAGAAGSWSGDFHNEGKDDVPTTLTGEFGATYGDSVGHIIGAFGASRQ